MTDEARPLRFFLDRLPGVCVIVTDARGVFTRFGPGAEAFFACAAEEAVGKLKYEAFHDPEELSACRGSAKFKAALERPGWSEEVWTVRPRAGEPFPARVTLIPLREGDAPGGALRGWIALYRKLED